MKKILGLIFAGLVAAAPVWGGERNSLEVAFETSNYRYREPHMKGPIKDSGHLQGVSMNFTHRSLMSEILGDNDNFVSLELIYMSGKVDYDGYLQDTAGNIVGTASSEGIHDWYVDGRLLFGQHFKLSDKLALDPFMGLAYRFLRDEGQKKSDSAYLRESNYVYMPIGTGLTWQMSETFKIVLKGEFDWLLQGKQKSGLSRFGPPYGDLSNTQKKGWGVRASVKLEQSLGKMGLFVEPFYRYWKIQNSEFDYYAAIDLGGGWYQYIGGIEPFNITREYGIRAGITF